MQKVYSLLAREDAQTMAEYALIIGGIGANHKRAESQGSRLLQRERQLLDDGGHEERSTPYARSAARSPTRDGYRAARTRRRTSSIEA